MLMMQGTAREQISRPTGDWVMRLNFSSWGFMRSPFLSFSSLYNEKTGMPISKGISSRNCSLAGKCPQTMRSILRMSTADYWAHSTGRYDPLCV